jgi:hypothetical protein
MNRNITPQISRQKIILISPLLFSIIPLLDLLNRNYSLIKYQSTIQSAIHILLGTVLIEVFLYFIFHQPQKVVLILTAVIFIFYSGSILRDAPVTIQLFGISISRAVFYAISLILVGIVTVRILRWNLRILSNITNYLLYVSVLWTLFAVITVGINLENSQRNPFNQVSPKFTPFSEQTRKLFKYSPDIYYIILDAYGGDEILNSLYGFDNSVFKQELARRGFYTPESSTSNYNRTKLSVASSLNFDYLSQLDNIGSHNGDKLLQKKLDNNRLFSYLEQQGYTTISISGGIEAMAIGFADYHFDERMNESEYFEMLLLSNTIIDSLHEVTGYKVNFINPRRILYENHKDSIEYALEKIGDVQQFTGLKPKIVFAHLLIPHPPFIFGTTNSIEDLSYPFCLCDGKTFSGSKDEYLLGYINQIGYTNNQILRLIDRIRNDSKNDPIIIIQGDHGPRSNVDLESVDNSCLPEAFSILNTYYFPDKNYSSLYQSISPVNTFRIVLNQYFGLSLKVLPDRNYFAPNYNVIDVTEAMSNTNCKKQQ